MPSAPAIRNAVKKHYERYVYPQFPLLSSIRRCDSYALNLDSLWARFNGERLAAADRRILLAGSGGFSPYPTAVANQTAEITALDLSKANLDRAKWHTRLHLYFNIAFIEGDLIHAPTILGQNDFHFVDCYGVLHHIPEVVSALKAIHSLLKKGGFARIMLYSKQARKSIQSARAALRFLNIHDVSKIKQIYRASPENSRFRQCVESISESRFDWGLADLFLHPYAKTYALDEVLDMLDQARLDPILFIHPGALADVGEELNRLRLLENDRLLTTNFMLFIGRVEDSAMRLQWNHFKSERDTLIALNPVIRKSLPLLPWPSWRPQSRLGFENPWIDWSGHRLLSRFRKPVRKSTLTVEQGEAIQPYVRAMLLTETAP